MSSFELREEVQALQDETYEIGQEHDVEAMDEGGIDDLLDGGLSSFCCGPLIQRSSRSGRDSCGVLGEHHESRYI
jgi:hypothetical protein